MCVCARYRRIVVRFDNSGLFNVYSYITPKLVGEKQQNYSENKDTINSPIGSNRISLLICLESNESNAKFSCVAHTGKCDQQLLPS